MFMAIFTLCVFMLLFTLVCTVCVTYPVLLQWLLILCRDHDDVTHADKRLCGISYDCIEICTTVVITVSIVAFCKLNQVYYCYYFECLIAPLSETMTSTCASHVTAVL